MASNAARVAQSQRIIPFCDSSGATRKFTCCCCCGPAVRALREQEEQGGAGRSTARQHQRATEQISFPAARLRLIRRAGEGPGRRQAGRTGSSTGGKRGVIWRGRPWHPLFRLSLSGPPLQDLPAGPLGADHRPAGRTTARAHGKTTKWPLPLLLTRPVTARKPQ